MSMHVFDAAVKRAQPARTQAAHEAVGPFAQLCVLASYPEHQSPKRSAPALALSTRCVDLGLRPPGDGSHSAAAERRLMVKPPSG